MTAKKADPLTVCPWCSESGEGELCRTHFDEAHDYWDAEGNIA